MAIPYTETWLTGPKDTQFYTRTYLPQTTALHAVIVFAHGIAEHIGRYVHFHPRLAESGIAVFAFDQRGFGRTAQDRDNKSKDSAVGKTSWDDQMADINWALNHVCSQFDRVPVFLMGQSMGGGEVLGFGSLASRHGTHAATVAQIRGVIATSPWVQLKKPFPKPALQVARKVAIVTPNTKSPVMIDKQALSHDQSVGEAYSQDPLVVSSTTLKQTVDTISEGDLLLKRNYRGWPAALPLLVIHGSSDKVTSFEASQTFVNQVAATAKKFIPYQDGYHELHNEPAAVADKLLYDIVSFVYECLDTSRA